MASLDVIWPGDACVDRLKKTDVYAVKQVYVKDFLWFFIQMIFDYILMFYVIFFQTREYEWYHPGNKGLKFNVLITTYEILRRDKVSE